MFYSYVLTLWKRVTVDFEKCKKIVSICLYSIFIFHIVCCGLKIFKQVLGGNTFKYFRVLCSVCVVAEM